MPPQPLEARLPSSRRHPEGLPRCQRWEVRKRKFWQCPRSARAGFPVCPLHGAGYESREKKQEALNPKTVSVKTGEHADPGTLKLLFRNNTELQLLYDHYMSLEVHPLDFRPHMAQLRALIHHWLQNRDMSQSENMAVAVESIVRLGRFAASVADVEQKMGAMTQADRDLSIQVVGEVLARFIPDDKLEEARKFCGDRILQVTGTRRRSPLWSRQNTQEEPMPAQSHAS